MWWSANWAKFHLLLHYCHPQKVHRLQVLPCSTATLSFSRNFLQLISRGSLLLALVSVDGLWLTQCHLALNKITFHALSSRLIGIKLTWWSCTTHRTLYLVLCDYDFCHTACISGLECWFINNNFTVKFCFFWSMLCAWFVGWKYERWYIE